MSLPNSYQNTVPFPPSISVDEIVQIHLNNGIENANQTLNSFMIYRKEYHRFVARLNLSVKDVSTFARNSWENEPKDVKDYYQRMAKKVKKCFKERAPSLCFIEYSPSPVDSSNDNHVPLDNKNQNFPSPPMDNTNDNHVPLGNKNQNFPPPPVDSSNDNHVPLDNKNQNFPSPPIDQDAHFNPIVSDNYFYMTDEFMNQIPEDLALAYEAIIQSLPK